MKVPATLSTLAVAATLATATQAATLSPTQYSVVAPTSGFYPDSSYTGTNSGGILSGGLGELTDGVTAAVNWNANPGPFMGWRNIDPTITFSFASAVSLVSFTVYMDDANGLGGVTPPDSISMGVQGGPAQTFAITDPASGAPFSVTLTLSAPVTGSVFEMALLEGGEWFMLSEVTFEGAVGADVPLPAAAPLLAAGLAGLGLFARRRKA